jgi:hypothetical protein
MHRGVKTALKKPYRDLGVFGGSKPATCPGRISKLQSTYFVAPAPQLTER